MAEKKKIYIAYTGGTIGSIETPDGLAPAPHGEFTHLLKKLLAPQAKDLPDYTIHEYKNLIDSSNATPNTWKKIAADIASKYDDYDGFIILHGTDTMAYSASALSFMLENLGKPVFLTGSQIPLSQPKSDALTNVYNALYVIGKYDIPEVCVSFGSMLMRGNRVIKEDAIHFDAFMSPNEDYLVSLYGHECWFNQRLIHPKPTQPFSYKAPTTEADVVVLKLFPGITADFVSRILHPAPQGVIIESYGVGNAPDKTPGLLEAIETASKSGTVFVNVTQCIHGAVDMGTYAVGSSLAKTGVIGCGDMTTVAAFTKLHYLCGQGLPPEKIRELMQKNICGELTPPGLQPAKQLMPQPPHHPSP